MSIIGPDGQPITAPIIGGPKHLTEFQPFTPDEMKLVAEPIQQALEAGVPPAAPVQFEIGVVYRLISTVLHLQTPLPDLRPQEEEE